MLKVGFRQMERYLSRELLRCQESCNYSCQVAQDCATEVRQVSLHDNGPKESQIYASENPMGLPLSEFGMSFWDTLRAIDQFM